ncbi:uncharacterized mitochondrial protein AtMg00810-like [Mercurialis annua]|uniref:uncharacterized mitochondrial protein AtMg00810-like n=1 Tax=Mercurialis annua TaxID=3986 RepID=UPI0024AD6E3B|nr:uncharacterized mitochondrial protein AtMg00810-like [Mercurialis annua]
MEQPPGFKDSKNPDFVCKLNKFLYGLKQAPRAWFNRLSQYLLHIGFICSIVDPSLFILRNDHMVILMLIYVDDIVLTGNNDTYINLLINKLGKEFALKDLGEFHFFLGIEVQRNQQGPTLSQIQYAKELLHKAGLLDSTHYKTPMALKSQMTPRDSDPVNATEYSLVGALQYLTYTRPDIVHAVNKVCQTLQNPTFGDMKAVKRILRYLKGTLHFGISFLKHSSLSLYGFCDADWAGCPTTRRSTTGYCIFLGANCISWSSKKQPTISRSSTVAEYRALASTTAELVWIQFLLRDIGILLH